MAISATQVKDLREKTGAGIMDCKRALEDAGGDMNQAISILKQQGLSKAAKKSGRTASDGLVEPYIHAGGRIGSLVEINCETDFVGRTSEFRSLAHDVAMQVAASKPQYVNADEIPEDAWAGLLQEYGTKEKAITAVCLLDQVFIKDGRRTIRDLVNDNIAKVGENIVIRRFARFELGGDLPAGETEETA